MPFEIRKVRGKPCYKVINKDTGQIHSKCSTLENAKKQVKIMYASDRKKRKKQN